MATLGSILSRRCGTAMTGLTVRLTLAVPDPQGGAPLVEEADVLLLPVSEAKKTRALREAEAYCAKCRDEAAAGAPNVEPRLEDELKLRFLAEAMRDPEDARRFFVEAKSLDTFRGCILPDQITLLMKQYEELIEREYVEIRVFNDAARLKAEAKQVFPAGRQ